MRLTDVDAICEKCPYKDETAVCSSCRIGNAPEVDAVPVVRCKYCEHCEWLYQKDWPGSDVYLVCTLHAKMTRFDGHCFWSEKKEGTLMGLIDREDTLNNIPDDLPYKASVKRVLYQTKTVDAVPVVRCKDCYHSTDHPFIDNTIDCDMLDITVNDDFYCKFGITADDFARMEGYIE